MVVLERLHCTVTSDWARHAPAARGLGLTGTKENPLVHPMLDMETMVLDRLLYRNKHQHRHAKYFQQLREVRRGLRSLASLQLDAALRALHDALQAGASRHALPTISMHLSLGHEQRLLPSHQAAVSVLQRLLAAARLVPRLLGALQRAARQLAAQLALTFFVPLCLTCLSLLGRIWVLCSQLLLDVVGVYGTVMELAPSLPRSARPASAGAPGEGLPAALSCAWPAGGVPALACEPGAQLEADAAAASDRWLLQPLPGSDRDPDAAVQWLAVEVDLAGAPGEGSGCRAPHAPRGPSDGLAAGEEGEDLGEPVVRGSVGLGLMREPPLAPPEEEPGPRVLAHALPALSLKPRAARCEPEERARAATTPVPARPEPSAGTGLAAAARPGPGRGGASPGRSATAPAHPPLVALPQPTTKPAFLAVHARQAATAAVPPGAGRSGLGTAGSMAQRRCDGSLKGLAGAAAHVPVLDTAEAAAGSQGDAPRPSTQPGAPPPAQLTGAGAAGPPLLLDASASARKRRRRAAGGGTAEEQAAGAQKSWEDWVEGPPTTAGPASAPPELQPPRRPAARGRGDPRGRGRRY
ncbi:hypothetical protein ACKKBG_A28270 [Auxenochlorella protothecoides x Auxenochlorella symbiontica]